jgi:hypothetical protein
MIQKLSEDGKVAVLYSPGFGAGWYTWNTDTPEILFDPAIVRLVEKNQFDELATYVVLKYPDIYTGGMKDLVVEWIPEGTLFKINDYDGSESIELKENEDWLVA